MRASVATAILLALTACRDRPADRGRATATATATASASASASADDLVAYLRGVRSLDPAALAAELDRWPLDRARWTATLVEPYRALFDDNRPAPRLAALRAQLAAPSSPAAKLTARAHFAGDARLTPGQAQLRWALPPLYPSFVVELDGIPLDTVFLHDGTRWRALAGLDELLAARVRALDESCATYLAHIGESHDCANAGWAIADAALRRNSERFTRACRIADNLCGKRSP
jgi:hypothetical protein